ncbi:MAG: toxin-antitoxin system YwqK family antitoxin [Prevotella sp.]|nr:toxin-antitoxin system YwqK family antitoxin [Prevotella sp.]
MKRLYLVLLSLIIASLAIAQRVSRSHIPHGAVFYNSRWQGVGSVDKAAYYRVLAVDGHGQKMFYDYYISGQLRAEKHYVSINRKDDHHTVLTGVCRTFYQSGRVESVMQYRNGKADGRAVSFFPSGNVGMKLNYRNGLLDGPSYTYNESGRLEYTTIWRNGIKVREQRGGKDQYIDRITNEDEFCEQYRKDEAVVMAQTKSILSAGRLDHEALPADFKQERRNSVPGIKPSPSRTGTSASDEKPVIHSSGMPETEQMVADVKYPDSPVAPSPTEEAASSLVPASLPAGSFSFPYLYSIIGDDDHRTQHVRSLDKIGSGHNLEVSQTITGFGAQKEIVYHHNMDYDEQSGIDKVTGASPRQLGFFGTLSGSQLTIQRINLFTWSEEEMLHFAADATAAGYKVLGGEDFRTAEGNFILEPAVRNTPAGSTSVVLTFTHREGLYAGLYHVQMEVK